MEIRKVARALDAELSGIDLREPLDVHGAQAVRQALLDHQVIFLRDQNLTPAQFLAFDEHHGRADRVPD